VNLDNIELVIKLTYTVEMITDLGGVNGLVALFSFEKTSVNEYDVNKLQTNIKRTNYNVYVFYIAH